jgi:preprotein translocase subunit SecG
MYYVLIVLFILVCAVLSLVILLQQGRGGDIASAFGGSSSQAAFGARSGATVLTKATAIFAALFMILALALSIIGQRGSGSVVSGTPAPPPIAAPKQTLPMPGPTAQPPRPPAAPAMPASK